MATDATYTGISASWHATAATGNGISTSADGTWIGIGGVTTSDLIQVGTQNIISASGHVTTTAFYELLPASSITVPGVTVTPGDSLSASLSEISSGEWSVNITDNTNGQSFNTTVAYTSSHSSAEWIEEDPSYSTSRQIPFDNYGTANFSSAATTASGTSLNLTGSRAQAITMVNSSDKAVSTPSVINSDGASFSVTRNSGT